MSDFKAKVYQIRFRLRLCPRPRWERLQRSPRRPSSWRRGVAAPKNSTSPLSTLWTSTPLFSRIFLSRPWHVWNYVIWWQRFNVRWTSWSRLDCLQLNGTSDLEITWSYVWLSWQDSASRFMQISVFLIQSASFILLVCRCAFLSTTFALSQSMTSFSFPSWHGLWWLNCEIHCSPLPWGLGLCTGCESVHFFLVFLDPQSKLPASLHNVWAGVVLARQTIDQLSHT